MRKCYVGLNGIHKIVKKRREELGFTQQYVADQIQVERPHLSAVENGRANLSLNCLESLIEVLDLKILITTGERPWNDEAN